MDASSCSTPRRWCDASSRCVASSAPTTERLRTIPTDRTLLAGPHRWDARFNRSPSPHDGAAVVADDFGLVAVPAVAAAGRQLPPVAATAARSAPCVRWVERGGAWVRHCCRRVGAARARRAGRTYRWIKGGVEMSSPDMWREPDGLTFPWFGACACGRSRRTHVVRDAFGKGGCGRTVRRRPRDRPRRRRAGVATRREPGATR